MKDKTTARERELERIIMEKIDEHETILNQEHFQRYEVKPRNVKMVVGEIETVVSFSIDCPKCGCGMYVEAKLFQSQQ